MTSGPKLMRTNNFNESYRFSEDFHEISFDLTPGPDFLHAPGPPGPQDPKLIRKPGFQAKNQGLKLNFIP